MSPRSRPGFSLVELLVVVAILGVLFALVLAAVQRVRESARRTDCQNRLRQQAVAVLNYESAHGVLPPGAIQGPFEPLGVPSDVSHGMWPLLLGHLDQQPVAEKYQLHRPFDHPDNQPAASARIPMLVCSNLPPERVEEWESASAFGGVSDFATIEVNPFLADIAAIDPVDNFAGPLPVNGTVRLIEVTDGASNTLLLVEAGGRPGLAWASPLNSVGLRQVLPGGGGSHRGGTNAALVDGSVRFLRDSMDLRTLGRLATRAGGETVGE
jgi:prepilin-type N-terminal cleavage/methylation domain-containing protein/prepilin-type processing-associated H-X9-DG protein